MTTTAGRVAGRLKLETEQLTRLRQRAAEQPDDVDLKARLAAKEEKTGSTSHALQVAIRLLRRLDQPTTEYQGLLLTTTGEVTADLFDVEVIVHLFWNAVESGEDWIEQNGPNVAFRGALFVFIVVFFRVLGKLVRGLVRRGLASDRVQASQLLRDMLASVVGNAIFILGILFGLAELGIELGPILAGLGIVGFIVGFALQDVLGNFAAGVILLTIRPYDVGDMIEAAGVYGEVSHMSLVSTTILTIDHQTLVIPNGKIWGDVIKNVTYQEERRVDMVFSIAYSEDVDQAEAVFVGILADHEKVLVDPPPMIKLHKLSENSVDFVVRPWVKTPDYWEVYWDVTRAVKRRFDEEGIRIPLPQREVRMLSADTHPQES
jgi:small conductance mechanosensitive channel